MKKTDLESSKEQKPQTGAWRVRSRCFVALCLVAFLGALAIQVVIGAKPANTPQFEDWSTKHLIFSGGQNSPPTPGGKTDPRAWNA